MTIRVHGLLGKPSAELMAEAATADLVVGGRRHLEALGVPEEKRQVLGTIGAAIERIQAEPAAKVVAVASGDPLLFGIVRRLRQAGLPVEVVPAISSVQAAFAAVALPWDDAQLVSAHAGGLDEALAACRSHPKVAVLTAPGRTIVEIAAGLAELERWYVLAECLGEAEERVRVLDGQAARELTEVASPHVVLVLAHHPDTDAALGDSPVLQGNASAGDRAGAAIESAAQAEEQRQLVVGQVTNSTASRNHADVIDKALGIKSLRFDGPAVRGLLAAWQQCDLIISHLALGATTRILAPQLVSKRSDPGVVVVDEAGNFAVPLVGGHHGGANDLARRVADALGATAALTTATDALGLPALDQLGWPCRGDVAGVTRAILDGKPVQIQRTQSWPLPPLPANVGEQNDGEPVAVIEVTDEVRTGGELPTVRLHPGSLVVGMGCNSGTSAEHLRGLLDKTLAEAGLAIESVSALTSHEVKAGELGLIKLAHELNVPFITYTSEQLDEYPAPNPSEYAAKAVGTPSVSEASVMARGAKLIVEKQKTTEATCAVGRIPARGKLSVVGLGPGARDLLTPRAIEAIRNATFLAGYAPYVRQIRDLARPGTEILATKMGTEQQRTAAAIEAARQGRNVAFVCGGDPAIYAMASPTLEMGTDGIDVEIVPGITAELAVSAILGAPLGHDHATISLSDLHTDWELIVRRVKAAAEGDFVVTFYNPRSRTRLHHLPDALAILAEHRPPTTPVALVSHAGRKQEMVKMSTLAEFQPEWVDMNTLVVVGSVTTKFVTTGDGERRIVTPRDYHWMDGRISAEQRKNYRHKDLPKASAAEYRGQEKDQA